MPNETPFIKLKAMSAVDGHDVIFYICEQQGEWTEPFVYEGIKIQPPFERPEWREGARILFPRGSSTSLNNTPMLATVQEYEKICAAVDAFNEHYAAKAREAIAAKAEDAKAEKAQEPRRILDVITLGSETTDSQCRNCPKNTTTHCGRDEVYIYNRSGWNRRTNRCLTAEKRYKAMRGMFGGDDG